MLEYKSKLFAFLDVVGFSTMVKKSETDSEERKKIEFFYSVCRTHPDWLKQFSSLPGLEFMVMSDSVVIACPVEEELTIDLLRSFLFALGFLQNNLAWMGVWVRGAVVYGKVDFNPEESFVVGPALVKAVELERSHAVYPRIILDPNLVNDLRFESIGQFISEINAFEKGNKIVFEWEHPMYKNRISKISKDVPLFIDFFTFNSVGDTKTDGIARNLRDALKGDISHYKKYRWLADYIVESLFLRSAGMHPEIEKLEKSLA